MKKLLLIALILILPVLSFADKKTEQFASLIGTNNVAKIEAAIKDGANVYGGSGDKAMTPLMIASQNDDALEVVKLLLKYGAKVNETNTQGDTALLLAAQTTTNTDIINTLIEAGADGVLDEDYSYSKIDYTFTGLSSNTMYTLEFLEKTSGTIYFSRDFKTLKEIPVTTNTSYTFDNSLVNISYDMDVSKLNTMDYVGVYKVGNEEYELPNESLDSN